MSDSADMVSISNSPVGHYKCSLKTSSRERGDVKLMAGRLILTSYKAWRGPSVKSTAL